jgi:tRNA (uracil-5-)-methyltransferase
MSEATRLPSPTPSPSTVKSAPPHKKIKIDDGSTTTTSTLGSNGIDGPTNKAPHQKQKPRKESSKKKGKAPKPGGHEEVTEFEVVDLLGRERVTQLESEGKDRIAKFGKFEEVEVDVEMLGAHGSLDPFFCVCKKECHAETIYILLGDGLAVTKDRDWVVVVPFCLPGERVVAKVYNNARLYSNADLVRVVRKSEERDEARVKCKYFGTCSGCQAGLWVLSCLCQLGC